MGYSHEKSNCAVSNTFMPFSAPSTTISLPSVQTVTEEDEVVTRDWIENFTTRVTGLCHAICYLNLKKKKKKKFQNKGPVLLFIRIYFGIDIISRRLLQWIARIKNVLKSKPTTRYRTYGNQIYEGKLRYWKWQRKWRWNNLWQDMHDQVGKISTKSWLVRLDLWG